MAHALSTYRQLISHLQNAGYALHPIRRYFEAPGKQPVVYLRHDVDRLPRRAVAMAEAEAVLGVRSTYYFRCDARMRFPEQAMRRIADLGHEPGFHYESLSRARGDAAAAARLFDRELAACRAIVPPTPWLTSWRISTTRPGCLSTYSPTTAAVSSVL